MRIYQYIKELKATISIIIHLFLDLNMVTGSAWITIAIFHGGLDYQIYRESLKGTSRFWDYQKEWINEYYLKTPCRERKIAISF